MTIAFNAAGGLALFLLAMAMMTDGLKVFGGQGLKVLLRDWTSTPWRGVASGALVTAIVQSSSAVTIATIGFVNAGVLSLRRALGVIFGANVGTTMTGWFVSLVGLGFKIEAFALPVLAVGVLTRMLAGGKRVQGLGNALAGFGLFFLGLAILKDGFAGFADAVDVAALGRHDGVAGLLLFVVFGLVATVLTQSSSAAIAIILTAAAAQVIGVEPAAAAIIGANVGTTSTALLAVIGATPSAKRVAAGHLVFNLVTGLVALALLPLVLALIAWLGTHAGMGDRPAPLLALFHTVFNLLGVVCLLPLSGALARWLERLFRTAAEDLARPQFLDKTVLGTPSLALTAMHRELERLASLVRDIALDALSPTAASAGRGVERAEAVLAVGAAVAEFATSMRMETLPRDVAEALPRVLRVARYLDEAARLLPEVAELRRAGSRLRQEPGRSLVGQALQVAAQTIAQLDTAAPPAPEADRLAEFQRAYQAAKAALLAAAASRALTVEQVDALLDALSHLRRVVDQLDKADEMLRAETAMDDTQMAPEPEDEAEEVDPPPAAG